MKTEAKIGLFVILALIVLGYFLIKIDKLKLGGKQDETYSVYAYFKNVAGLSTNATVRLQGYVIGKVSRIGLSEGRVKVIMSIRKSVPLFTDSSASVKTIGLLGEKYVEVTLGPRKGVPLKDNDEIRAGEEGGMDALVDTLGQIGSDLKEVTASLRKSIGRGEGNERLERILNNIERITADLRNITQGNKDNVDEALENIRKITADLDKKIPGISEDLKILAADLKEVVKDNKSNVKDSIENIKKLTDRLDEIIKKVQEGQGTVGKLMSESTLHDNLNKTIKNLEDKVENAGVILQQASYFSFSLGFRGEYYLQGEELKNYISFKLRTWENMYFFAEIVDDNLARIYDPDYDPDEDIIVFDRDMTLTLHSAVEFGDFVLRGGLTENKFGGAMDIFTFNDALRFTLEGWDVGRTEGPHLKFSLNYRFYNRFYINAGYDDPLDDKRGQAFMGVGYSWLY